MEGKKKIGNIIAIANLFLLIIVWLCSKVRAI